MSDGWPNVWPNAQTTVFNMKASNVSVLSTNQWIAKWNS